MKSLHCEGQGRVRLVDIPAPTPRPGEALVRIEASAICGSERSSFVNGYPGNTGHEACGIIVDPGHSDLRTGDRVGISAVAGCDRCARCKAGQELFCERGPTAATGMHAEYVAVPVSTLRRLPEGMDAAIGAMVTGDTLGVPTRGLRKAPPEPTDTVLVIGLGPVGLGHILVRVFEGADVTGIEPSTYRRDLALRLGASTVHPPGTHDRHRYRLVIECTGRPDCITQAFEFVDSGGTVLQSGECAEVHLKPSETFIRREVTYTGGWYYASEDYPRMLELVKRGLPLDRMRTHEVPARDAEGAIAEFLAGRTGKVVVRWTEA
jgi:L-iditol 2-dehydrogenase